VLRQMHIIAEPPKHRGKEALVLLDRLLEALPLDAPPHLAVPPSSATAIVATGTGAPLPPPPASQPKKPMPPPLLPAGPDQAAGGAGTATPADDGDDDDVNMDLEEGQLADSPVAQPPLPPPGMQDAMPQQLPRPPAASAPGAVLVWLRAGKSIAHTELQWRISAEGIYLGDANVNDGVLYADPAALRPGGMLCRAAATLWLGRVPRLVGEASLRKECSKAGGVERIVLPKREEAFVTFSGMRCVDVTHCIAASYQHMLQMPLWGHRALHPSA
jgi:hypothetical protein